jgi:hypothetical protein
MTPPEPAALPLLGGFGTRFAFGEPREDAMSLDDDDLVTPEVVRKIRSENQALLEASESMRASIETGRLDQAAPIAAALGEVLRQHVLLVDGVLDVLTPDDVAPRRERR